MQLSSGHHLTYCTNIHPAETWHKTFKAIKTHVPVVKDKINWDASFGIGLRLSNRAAVELNREQNLNQFKQWLAQHRCYVFTINGFPYGGFHRQKVKDHVHKPDWTTNERLEYTTLLIDILAQLPAESETKGISTSPLSYKPWILTTGATKHEVMTKSTQNLLRAILHMHKLHEQTEQCIHLDIEPEPDGLIENTDEVITYFDTYLLPAGADFLHKHAGISRSNAEAVIKKHLQICYDVCHFAVEFEMPGQSMLALKKSGIEIGKIQLSAALKAQFDNQKERNTLIKNEFARLNEPTYLHQVISKEDRGKLRRYTDLPEALKSPNELNATEWRTHFHVPLFVEEYDELRSTQGDIKDTLTLLKQDSVTSTKHLEIETYTWEVLPKRLQANLDDSIAREIDWVLNAI